MIRLNKGFGKVAALGATSLVLALGLGACGGDDGGQDAALSPEAAQGKAYVAANCLGCHTTNGASSSGPTLKGLAGSQIKLQDDRTVTADDAYLKEAIVNPGATTVAGYGQSMVSAFPPGSVSDQEADQIVAYIKTLK